MSWWRRLLGLAPPGADGPSAAPPAEAPPAPAPPAAAQVSAAPRAAEPLPPLPPLPELPPLAPTALSPGDRVFVRKRGLVVVRGASDAGVEVGGEKKADGTLTYRPEQVRRLFRRLVDRETAERLVARLSEPLAPAPFDDWPALSARAEEVLARGVPDEMAETLRRLWALPAPLTDAAFARIETLEGAIVAEIAHATGGSLPKLRAALRAGTPAYGKVAPVREVTAPRAPPSPPAGWRWEGGFHLFDRLAVGEWPSERTERRGQSLTVEAPTGLWDVLYREDDEGAGAWVVVHRDHLAAFDALLAGAGEFAALNTEGATMRFVDRELRDDAGFQRALGEGDPGHRGFACALTGDGEVEIRAVRIGDACVLFHLDA